MFPNDTCELSENKFIKQPISVFINIISCMMIFFYYKKNHSIILLSLLLFQIFHAFSHAVHYHGNIEFLNFINSRPNHRFGVQQFIQHLLAFNINVSFMKHYKYNIYLKTSILIILLDIYYFIFENNIIIGILTQGLLVFLTIYKNFTYIEMLNKLCILTAILIILLINEKKNCKKMLKFKKLPYHALVEVFGLFYFYLIIKIFHH
jgi:hypothetical protein